MPVDEKAPKSGRVSPAAQRGGGRSELAGLRATCRRQAYVIDALDAAMSTLRQRVAALTATNTDLSRTAARGLIAAGRLDPRAWHWLWPERRADAQRMLGR